MTDQSKASALDPLDFIIEGCAYCEPNGTMFAPTTRDVGAARSQLSQLRSDLEAARREAAEVRAATIEECAKILESSRLDYVPAVVANIRSLLAAAPDRRGTR